MKKLHGNSPESKNVTCKGIFISIVFLWKLKLNKRKLEYTNPSETAKI